MSNIDKIRSDRWYDPQLNLIGIIWTEQTEHTTENINKYENT